MNIKAVIFDFDGVLVDTEKLYNIYWRKAAKDLGYDLTYEDSLELRSLDKNLAIEFFKDLFGEDCHYQQIRTKRIELMKESVAKSGIKAKEGVCELLETLKSLNIKTAICSASDYQTIENNLKLADIKNDFDKIISTTSVSKGKPFADVYLYACQMLNLNANETLVVEDSPNGVKSAFSAGCNVVMIPDMTEPTADLLPKLTMTLKNMKALQEQLLKKSF